MEFVRCVCGIWVGPEWLTTKTLLERGGGREGYRKNIQQHVTRGDAPEGYKDFGGRVALGIKEYKTVGRAVQRFAAALSQDGVKRWMVKECLDDLSLVET